MPRNLTFIFLMSIFLVSTAGHAFEYKKDEKGIKVFSHQWDGAHKSGSITFEIESHSRESSTPAGQYDLSTSKGNGVFQPSDACTVKFEGVLEYLVDNTAQSKTPLKMIFSGEGCQKYVENFAYKSVVMLPIWNITGPAGSDSNLSVRIVNTAITECGTGNSLREKMIDCAGKNKKLAIRLVRANTPTQWTLTAFNEKSTAVWRDDSTKIYWSGPPKVAKVATWAEASQICSSDLYLKNLPKPAILEKAIESGLLLLYPLPGVYWTNEVRSTPPDERKMATTYHTVGQPSDQLTFAIVDSTDVNRKSYFQCVSQ